MGKREVGAVVWEVVLMNYSDELKIRGGCCHVGSCVDELQ